MVYMRLYSTLFHITLPWTVLSSWPDFSERGEFSQYFSRKKERKKESVSLCTLRRCRRGEHRVRTGVFMDLHTLFFFALILVLFCSICSTDFEIGHLLKDRTFFLSDLRFEEMSDPTNGGKSAQSLKESESWSPISKTLEKRIRVPLQEKWKTDVRSQNIWLGDVRSSKKTGKTRKKAAKIRGNSGPTPVARNCLRG